MSKVSEYIESKGPLVREYVEALRAIEIEEGRKDIIVPFAATKLPSGDMIAFEGGVVLGFERDTKVYVYFDVRSSNAVRVAVSNAMKTLSNNVICDDLILCSEVGMLQGIDALLKYAEELEDESSQFASQKLANGFH